MLQTIKVDKLSPRRNRRITNPIHATTTHTNNEVCLEWATVELDSAEIGIEIDPQDRRTQIPNNLPVTKPFSFLRGS